jgi:hypothetical protein
MSSLTIDGDATLTSASPTTITLPDSSSFVGTIQWSQGYGSRTSADIIGGHGGLREPTTPQQYREASAKVILSDLARQGGESLSSTIDSSVLATQFSTYAVLSNSVGHGIQILSQALASDWTILPDGTLWLGTHAWSASTAKYELINHDTERSFFELAPGDGSYSIRPGQTIEGKHITAVTFRIIGSNHRIVIEYTHE